MRWTHSVSSGRDMIAVVAQSVCSWCIDLMLEATFTRRSLGDRGVKSVDVS